MGHVRGMDYRAADDVYFELLQEQGTPMFEKIRTTAFPQTYRVMFAFCARTNFLKAAMFDMIDSDNPYAFNALFRCFCEHYLKFTYVFVRFLVEKSDAVGREYSAFCGAREIRQYAAAVVDAEKLIGNEIVAELSGFLEKYFPDAAHISSEQLKRESSKFEYRSILKFLSQHPAVLGPQNTALAHILPKYARLSSFIHGGPASEREMYMHSIDDALGACQKDAELVFVMTASVLLFTAMAVGREYPEHLKLAANVDAVIKGARHAAGEEAPDSTSADAPESAPDGTTDDDIPF
jgi:hypothetical protein